MTKVVVNGALGRMGREVLKAVLADKDLELAGAVDVINAGDTLRKAANIDNDIVVTNDLAKTLDEVKPQIVVDFTRPDVVMSNLRVILSKGVRAVVGTTGFSKEDFKELEKLSSENNTAVLIAPNFSIGANLMMRLSEEAIKYLPKAEIIELHHDKKLDAPSGTSVLTAERLSKARGGYIQQGHPDEEEKLKGARGADYEGIRIHSVRLEGYVAHQEVIFGGFGETFIIRHDSISRESFMPGVTMACREMPKYNGLIYGLDKLMQ